MNREGPASRRATAALGLGLFAAAVVGGFVLFLAGGVGASPSLSLVVAPKITSLSAYDGAAGNSVAIEGTNLGDATVVKFGAVVVTPTSNTATEIDANVPLTGFSSGVVTVTTPGGTAASSKPFAITKITGFSPASAVDGTIVTIAGQGLGSATVVDFVGHAGVPLAAAATATSVKVAVPADAAVGDLFVETPNVPAGSVSTAAAFKPLPSITTLTPPDGEVATTVHIIGSNFLNVGLVKFGKLDAVNVHDVSATEVDADVPVASTGGTVSVQTLAGTAVSKTPFAITKVTGFTPLAAAAGQTITITGQGLADVSAVDFVGHAGVVPTSTSPTTAKVVVPNDANSGQLLVHAPAAGGLLTTGTFKAIPTITGVTPLDGAVGTPVTIAGANFFASVGMVVKFGTVMAPIYDVVSPTEIDTTIPSGFSSGRITLVSQEGTAVSTQAFSVTKVTGVSPASAAANATVTIFGQGLASATLVDFPSPGGTVSAAPLSTTATSVKVAVPPTAQDGVLTVHTPNIAGAGIATPQPFKPLPKITGFDANPHAAGDTVIVNGSNLVAAGPVSAKLGSLSITPTNVAASSFQFVVPDGAVSSLVTFKNADGTATSTMLKVLPRIDSITPGGSVRSLVVIDGGGFTGTKSVKFGNNTETATFTVGAGGASLMVTVPPNVTDGTIGVTNAGGTTLSSSFNVMPTITSFTPGSGPVGATVTITGTGLLSVTVVTFGTRLAAATNVTATSLKVVVPPGATTSTITVSTPNATSAPSAVTFTVTMTVTGVLPTHQDYGGAVLLAGSGLSGVTEVDFNGIAGTGLSASSNNVTVHLPASGAVSGTITLHAGAVTFAAPGSFSLVHVSGWVVGVTGSRTPGSDVFISGTGFTGTTAVKFDGTAATFFEVLDDGDIWTKVPNNAATGPIEVDNGGTAMSANSYAPQYTLTAAKSGTGSGTVTSADTNINCGATCAALYDEGTVVDLTATPATGSTFVQWSGGTCDGSTNPVCEVTAKAGGDTETAVFAVNMYKVNVATNGNGPTLGTVTSDVGGINCPQSACSAQFAYGTHVTLTAVAGAFPFDDWQALTQASPCNLSTSTTCSFTVTNDVFVTADFG